MTDEDRNQEERKLTPADKIWRLEYRLREMEKKLKDLTDKVADLEKNRHTYILSDPTVIKILIALGAIIVTFVTGQTINFGG